MAKKDQYIEAIIRSLNRGVDWIDFSAIVGAVLLQGTRISWYMLYRRDRFGIMFYRDILPAYKILDIMYDQEDLGKFIFKLPIEDRGDDFLVEDRAGNSVLEFQFTKALGLTDNSDSIREVVHDYELALLGSTGGGFSIKEGPDLAIKYLNKALDRKQNKSFTDKSMLVVVDDKILAFNYSDKYKEKFQEEIGLFAMQYNITAGRIAYSPALYSDKALIGVDFRNGKEEWFDFNRRANG